MFTFPIYVVLQRHDSHYRLGIFIRFECPQCICQNSLKCIHYALKNTYACHISTFLAFSQWVLTMPHASTSLCNATSQNHHLTHQISRTTYLVALESESLLTTSENKQITWVTYEGWLQDWQATIWIELVRSGISAMSDLSAKLRPSIRPWASRTEFTVHI